MEKKYIELPFEVKAISDDDSEFFTFEGYASTFGNVDFGDDVVVKGAFTESLSTLTPVVLWQHDMREPIGISAEHREDEKGLFVRGKLPKDDTLVSGRVIPQMKVGSIKKLSIGYSIADFDIKDGIRYLKKLILHEYSLVTFPMNDMAAITGMKSAMSVDDLETLDKKEFEQLLRSSGVLSRKACKAIASVFIGQRDADDNEQRDVEHEAMMKKLSVLTKLYK